MLGNLATTSGQAALTINQNGGGLLINASAGGITKFMVDSGGSATIAGHLVLSNPAAKTTFGGIAYAWPGAIPSNGYVLSAQTNGQLNWVAQLSSGTNWWNEFAGALSPINIGDDLLLGGNTTASAKMAFTGLMGNQTQASFSGQLVVMPDNGYGGNASISGTLTLGAFSNPVIQTTANQGLTIGGGTTGNITFSPLNGASGASITPSQTNNVDLGTSAYQWRNIYGQNIYSNGTLLTFGGYWNLVSGIGVSNGGYITPINSTADLLIGGQSTASATFAVLGLSNSLHQTTASVSGNFVVMPNNGYGGKVGIGYTNPGTAALAVNGNVGIGTTSPLVALDVRGNSGTLSVASVSGTTSFASLVVDNSGNGDLITASSSAIGTNLGRTQFTVTNTGNVYGRSWTDLDNTNYFMDLNSSTTSLVAAGKVGIGLAPGVTPATALDVRGLSLGTSVIASVSGQLIVMPNGGWGGQVGIGYTSPGTAALAVSGNVGIGTTSPLVALDVRSNSGTISVASVSGTTAFASLVVDQSGLGDIFTASAAGLPLFTIQRSGSLVMSGYKASINFTGTGPTRLPLPPVRTLPLIPDWVV